MDGPIQIIASKYYERQCFEHRYFKRHRDDIPVTKRFLDFLDILFPLFPSSIIRFATNKRLEKKRRIKLARAQEYLHSIIRYLKIDG